MPEGYVYDLLFEFCKTDRNQNIICICISFCTAVLLRSCHLSQFQPKMNIIEARLSLPKHHGECESFFFLFYNLFISLKGSLILILLFQVIDVNPSLSSNIYNSHPAKLVRKYSRWLLLRTI